MKTKPSKEDDLRAILSELVKAAKNNGIAADGSVEYSIPHDLAVRSGLLECEFCDGYDWDVHSKIIINGTVKC